MDVELVDVVKLSQQKDFIQLPTSFAVTEDHLYFILDKKAANIKIYKPSGKLVKTFGRKGIGPNEFQEPRYIDYHQGRLAIMDLGTRKVYIYSRAGKNDLKKEKDFLCISLGDDLCINGDRVMIAGYKTDQNDRPYSLYIRNYRNHKNEFLLPSEIKYGFGSVKEYQNEFRKNLKIVPIGIQSYFDWLGDDVYLVWQGNLRIIKINVRTKKRSFFGKHTQNYTQPKASQKMINAYKRRDTREWLKERNKLCYVSDIFAAPEYIMVKYLRPGKGQGPQALRARLQFYTPEGTFINEVELPRKEYNLYYFKRDEEILYALSLETTEELQEIYSIYRYKIVR
jgi:hypothetical protein